MVSYDHGSWVRLAVNCMVKVPNPEVTYEFSLQQHVQNSSLPTQLCIQHEQRDKRSDGVNVTTCLLEVLRSRIFGVHLHVLEAVVTFAFLLRFLVGLFRRDILILLSQARTIKMYPTK
jgi:hypothetical protein